jgi:hypothetical protein
MASRPWSKSDFVRQQMKRLPLPLGINISVQSFYDPIIGEEELSGLLSFTENRIYLMPDEVKQTCMILDVAADEDGSATILGLGKRRVESDLGEPFDWTTTPNGGFVETCTIIFKVFYTIVIKDNPLTTASYIAGKFEQLDKVK